MILNPEQRVIERVTWRWISKDIDRTDIPRKKGFQRDRAEQCVVEIIGWPWLRGVQGLRLIVNKKERTSSSDWSPRRILPQVKIDQERLMLLSYDQTEEGGGWR